MRRTCLSGLIALLAAPLPGRGDDLELFGGKGLELKADIKRIDVEKEPKEEEVFGEEKAIRGFVKKATASRRQVLAKGLEKTVAGLVKEMKLDAAAKQKLEALGTRAYEAAVAEWGVKCREWAVAMIDQSGEEALNGWDPDQLASNQQIVATEPEETAEWRDGLKQILTAEQWAAREEKENAGMEKLRKEFADYLASSEAQAGEMMASGMDSLLSRILQHGGIDEDRRKKLKQAAGEAVKVTLAGWRVRAEKQLLKMDESTRERMTQRNGLMGVNTSDKANQPQEQTVWKEALAQVLTEVERAQVEERQRVSRGRRAESLGMVLVADLDRLVGFSEKQRSGLLELVVKPLQGLPAHYFDAPEGSGHYSIDMAQMYRQIKRIKEEQISGLLDATQMKRWKEVTPNQLSRNYGYMRERIDAGEVPPAAEMDEVEVERVLSSFLHQEARKMKLKMQAMMESQVENISRVSSPGPEAVTVLRTAAKGAAEEMAMGSINNLTSWVRSQFQSLKPADVPARLQSLNFPYFGERQASAEPKLWTAAVERLLTGPQREAWKVECAAREAWRLRGISAMVLTELEKRVPLKPEQREALHKKLSAVISDYEPDFANFFSSAWHLQGYYALVPLAIMEDKEMEEFFDKKEWETVKEKCLGNALQYADMLRRNHKSRTGK